MQKKQVSPVSKFQSGIKLADSMVSAWNRAGKTTFSIKDDIRIHHGLAGLALMFVGGITKSPGIAGIGWGLAKDDIMDAPYWLKFK